MRFYFICFIFVWHNINAQTKIEEAKAFFKNHDFSSVIRLLTPIRSSENNYAEAQYWLGRVATEEKKFDQAVSHFENATKGNSHAAEYHNWLGVLYGVIAMDSNPIKQAFLAPKIKNEFEMAASIEPNNIQTQWGLVYYYVKAPGFLGGSWEKAFNCARIIDRLNHAQGLSAQGFIYENQGAKAKAKTLYLLSAKLEPNFKETEEGLRRLSR